MFRRLNISRAGRALADAKRALGPAKRELDALVAVAQSAREDRARVTAAGAALERIASGRLYRLRDLPSFAALLAEIGISRTTAFKWRRIASQLEAESIDALGVEAAYEKARPAPDAEHPAAEAAQRVAERLHALGLSADVTPVRRKGGPHVRVEMSEDAWRTLLRTRR